MRKLLMDYSMTPKFDLNAENPFSEDTRLWHVWIDICTTHARSSILDVDRMMRMHDMSWDYYDEALVELVEAGYLEIIYTVENEA